MGNSLAQFPLLPPRRVLVAGDAELAMRSSVPELGFRGHDDGGHHLPELGLWDLSRKSAMAELHDVLGEQHLYLGQSE
jgi:hypothetical protein